MLRGCYNIFVKYYVRFGLWPDNERSGIGEAYRRIHGGPAYEEGVSVYEASWDDRKRRWLLWANDETFSFAPTLDAVLSEKRDIFLVTGDEVGVGTDGEPLLRNLKLIKKLSARDIFNPEVYSFENILDNDYELEESPVKVKTVLVMHKTPGQAPVLKEIDGTMDAVQKLVGDEDLAWTNMGNDVLMFASEFPKGKPNFPIGQPIDPTVLARAKERLAGTPIFRDGEQISIEEFLQPRKEMIYGDVVFVKLKFPEAEEIDFSEFPWPWDEALARDYEDGEVPTELEFFSLSEDEVNSLRTRFNW